MKALVQYWLLTDAVKQQLDAYFIDLLGVWSNHWGIYQTVDWNVASVEMLDLENIDLADSLTLSADGEDFLFSLNGEKVKQKVVNEFIQKKTGFTDSKLLSNVFVKSMNDLQLRCLEHCEYVSAEIAFSNTDKKSVTPFYSKIPVTKIIVSAGDLSMELILSMSVLNAILAKKIQQQPSPAISRGVFEKRLSSISNEVVRLDIDYGSVDISVSELSTISVGDVICLDNATSSPLTVKDKKNNPLFSGYLGVNNNMLALKVAADK